MLEILTFFLSLIYFKTVQITDNAAVKINDLSITCLEKEVKSVTTTKAAVTISINRYIIR